MDTYGIFINVRLGINSKCYLNVSFNTRIKNQLVLKNALLSSLKTWTQNRLNNELIE